MFEVLLENIENDKKLMVALPVIPSIGDWIDLEGYDDFTDGESLLTVKRVILYPSSEKSIVHLYNGEDVWV